MELTAKLFELKKEEFGPALNASLTAVLLNPMVLGLVDTFLNWHTEEIFKKEKKTKELAGA